MWITDTPRPDAWSDAVRHLRRVDPVLRAVIDRVGPCTLTPRRDYFVVLSKAIFSQQISTAVAATLFGRFRDLFPQRRPTPTLVLDALTRSEDALRHCGLSRPKAKYLQDLARHFIEKKIPVRRLASMGDEEVIESLVAVKGIGRWTAEMFLIFVMNRPDVLPVDDLGLREAAREVFGRPARPTAAELTAMAEPWRPYRTVATWYLWRRASVPLPVSATPTRAGTRTARARNTPRTATAPR